MPTCSKCNAGNREGARFCDVCGTPLGAVLAPEASFEASAPTEVASGRYELLRLLGEGGKKRVHLARDTLLQREVALALIKAEGLDVTARARVLREAQAMGRLGAHPHIVAVFDLGEEQGQPYLVTELMAGGDLESLIERAPNGRLPVARVLELGQGICKGLAFAHEQGLVHRDLKPGNVWLTKDGQPKIGDFGLALPLERSRLTQEGTIVGTVAYLPPEQALGGEVTPRADLYSLGALLYELISGRPPFLGDDPVSVISQHINTPPVAPSWHAPDCPRALEALVLRLLAKDPAERPDSAQDVLAALQAIEPEEGAERPRSDLEEPSLDALASGVFVGRQRELSTLRAALEEALSAHGRLLTLVGEPGIGKTRTVLELATYARLRGARVLVGRCYEAQGAPPYWPFVQALRAYVRERGAEALRAELAGGAAVVAELLPELQEKLPGLAPPPAVDLPQARFRLFDSVSSFLQSASRSQPLLLALDDLHWADAGSLALLEFLAGDLEGARLLVVGTYRDVELSRGHPLARTLGELARERLFERVLLRGLSEEDVRRFIEASAGIPAPAELVKAVYTQTEGNPLFLTEVVRLLVQEGELSPARLAGRETWSVRIPEGVREVIGRRLDRLTERCNETLTLAAVLGREFTLAQLAAMVDDLSEERLLEVLEEALQARVLEELPRSVGRYQFTHALIQETLAEELSSTRRARLHARIGEALERLYGEEAEQHAAELAFHFAEAEALMGPEKLVRYALAAGEAALAAHAYEEALSYFERALVAREGAEMDAEIAALLFGLGRAQLATLAPREWGPTVTSLRRAFDYYSQTGDVSHAVAVAAHPLPHLLGLGQTEIGDLIARALTLVPPDSIEAGGLLSKYGWLSGFKEADYEAAQLAFQRALEIAQQQDDTGVERRTLAYAAFVDAFHRRWEDCLTRGLRAVELANQAEDLHTEITARRPVSWALTVAGEREQSRFHASAALACAERLRERWSLASTSFENELLSLYEGDWHAARQMSELGLTAQPWDARHLGLRAVLEYEVGDFDAGAVYVARLQEVAESVPLPGPTADHVYVAIVIPLVARIACVDDRREAAVEAAERVLSLPRLVPVLAMLARSGLALIAVQRSDAQAAEVLYAALEPERGTAYFFIPFAVDRLLALLATTCGRIEAAVSHFEEGLAFCDRAGYRSELAWTAFEYADALLTRGGPDDRGKAVALQDKALATARELGMRPLMERVLAHRPILTA